MSTAQSIDVITETPAVEEIAHLIAGVVAVGQAHRLLESAGYSACIVANRITIDGEIEAQLTTANDRSWWQVFRSDGTPPVWTVGVESVTNWIGCVEL